VDVETGKTLLTLPRNAGDSAMFSPDETKIATSGYDRKNENYTAQIWDAKSGKYLHLFALPNTSVYRGYFSPDGTKFLTRCFDKTARIWDVESGKELHKLEGHTDVINTALFSPDGKKIVTTSAGLKKDENRYVGTIYVWNVASGKELHKFPELLGGVRDAVFSPDGKKIVTVNGKNGWAPSNARIWDVETGKELQTLPEAQDFIVFSPDGTKIVTAGKEHTAIIWDAATGKELRRLQGDTNSRANVGNYIIDLISYDPMVSSVTFSPDGKKLVTASNDGSVRIYDLSAMEKK
jgi:WD40 repeat protein